MVSLEMEAGAAQEADGLITEVPGIALGISTADCIPVFFWDPEYHAAGIAHTGWRGLKSGMITEMISWFRDYFRSQKKSLQVAFGPAIRRCCYEVGEEFRDFFPGFYFEVDSPSKAKRGRMDLLAAARDQALAQGILAEHIFDAGICTSCQNDRFFSARREGTSERIFSVIQILG